MRKSLHSVRGFIWEVILGTVIGVIFGDTRTRSLDYSSCRACVPGLGRRWTMECASLFNASIRYRVRGAEMPKKGLQVVTLSK